MVLEPELKVPIKLTGKLPKGITEGPIYSLQKGAASAAGGAWNVTLVCEPWKCSLGSPGLIVYAAEAVLGLKS